MRKLLVASQKSGVGKTTTAINLAGGAAMAGTRVLLLEADPLSNISIALNLMQHPRRQPLRELGIDLPGVLCAEVIPGLDVLSPYEQGGCSDEEFDGLVRLLAAPAVQDAYGCRIVDAPPFLGANPAQLLQMCDEYVLVMRAEPMAYRTLPAFTELVQRAKCSGRAVPMRGILLTLPDGEMSGGRWERELRGRFGSRILPDVVPFDEDMRQVHESGQIFCHSHPDAPAAAKYHALVEALALAEEGSRGPLSSATLLRKAAAALPAATISVGPAVAVLVPAATSARDNRIESIALPATAAWTATTQRAEAIGPPQVKPPSSAFNDAPLPPPPRARQPVRPMMPPRSRKERLSPVPSDEEIPSLDDMLAQKSPRLPLPAVAPLQPAQSPAPPASAPPARAAASSPRTNAGAQKKVSPAAPSSNGFGTILVVGLAVLIGGGLRLVNFTNLSAKEFKPPEFLLPIVVGMLVGAAVVLFLRQSSPAPSTGTARKSGARPASQAPPTKAN